MKFIVEPKDSIFKCENGNRIINDYRCDGQYDCCGFQDKCDDHSDEENCTRDLSGKNGEKMNVSTGTVINVVT